MAVLEPYLHFNGNAREAMEFYKVIANLFQAPADIGDYSFVGRDDQSVFAGNGYYESSARYVNHGCLPFACAITPGTGGNH